MWYEVASMGRRSPEVVFLGSAFAVLAAACATGGQSQPGDLDGSVSGDATEPLDSGSIDRGPRDGGPDGRDRDRPDATTSMDDQAEGGGAADDGLASGDGPSAEAPAESSADGGSADAEEGDAELGDSMVGDSMVGDSMVGDASFGDAASPDAGPCTTCPSGFTCARGNYCVTPTGVPAFGHVFVIVLDNQPLSAIRGSASAPYLNSLMSTYAYATAYTTTNHPSLPNYIELTSGNTQEIACDCRPGATNSCTTLNCDAPLVVTSTCTCPQSVTHLGDALDGAGIPWREYAESMGAPCNPAGADGGTHFAVNHVPFLYYDDVFMNKTRCQDQVRDYSDFGTDLLGGAIRFALITPNLCHDMHDTCAGTPVGQGDQWLSTQVPTLLGTPGFAAAGRTSSSSSATSRPTSPLGRRRPFRSSWSLRWQGKGRRPRRTTTTRCSRPSRTASAFNGSAAPRRPRPSPTSGGEGGHSG